MEKLEPRGRSTRLIHHGGEHAVPYPEIRKTRYTKDFGYGFYCTDLKEQAIKWCCRKGNKGAVSCYEYTPDDSLRNITFGETDEWLDFVAACRKGIDHAFDIVEGPMADDQIWDFIDDYLDGNITREEFWGIAKFRHPTHQISFHTERALQTIKYISHEVVQRNG